MKNSADLGGGCYLVSVDNTLLDLQNSSYPTEPHSIIIANYWPSIRSRWLDIGKIIFCVCLWTKMCLMDCFNLLCVYTRSGSRSKHSIWFSWPTRRDSHEIVYHLPLDQLGFSCTSITKSTMHRSLQNYTNNTVLNYSWFDNKHTALKQVQCSPLKEWIFFAHMLYTWQHCSIAFEQFSSKFELTSTTSIHKKLRKNCLRNVEPTSK